MAGNSAAAAEMRECAALMKDSGLTVKASTGWEGRGRSSSVNYWAVLAHHTAAENDNDALLINGRSDVPGPLCNWALHENGDWVLIASGRANHAGEGTLPSSESYGIEATGPQDYPDKYGPSAFPQNYQSYELGVACILAVMGQDTGDLFGHKETARPIGRKIDPYFSMDSFRTGVKAEDPGRPEADMDSTEHRWLREIYQALQAEGTAGDVVKSMEILFARVRKLEDGLDLVCEHLGVPFDQVDVEAIPGLGE
jgi:N-acetylmuramoyl-L-alanine amidase